MERTSEIKDGVNHITYRVKAVTGLYDFTLAADPAYPATSVEARELAQMLRPQQSPDTRSELQRMRAAAAAPLL